MNARLHIFGSARFSNCIFLPLPGTLRLPLNFLSKQRSEKPGWLTQVVFRSINHAFVNRQRIFCLLAANTTKAAETALSVVLSKILLLFSTIIYLACKLTMGYCFLHLGYRPESIAFYCFRITF